MAESQMMDSSFVFVKKGVCCSLLFSVPGSGVQNSKMAIMIALPSETTSLANVEISSPDPLFKRVLPIFKR
jgi:hypothetical protein